MLPVAYGLNDDVTITNSAIAFLFIFSFVFVCVRVCVCTRVCVRVCVYACVCVTDCLITIDSLKANILCFNHIKIESGLC